MSYVTRTRVWGSGWSGRLCEPGWEQGSVTAGQISLSRRAAMSLETLGGGGRRTDAICQKKASALGQDPEGIILLCALQRGRKTISLGEQRCDIRHTSHRGALRKQGDQYEPLQLEGPWWPESGRQHPGLQEEVLGFLIYSTTEQEIFVLTSVGSEEESDTSTQFCSGNWKAAAALRRWETSKRSTLGWGLWGGTREVGCSRDTEM